MFWLVFLLRKAVAGLEGFLKILISFYSYFFMAVCNYFCYIMLPHALYTAKEARSRLHFILLVECLGSCAHISISIYGFQLSQVHGFMCNSSEHAAIMLMRERLERCALCGEQTHIYTIYTRLVLCLWWSWLLVLLWWTRRLSSLPRAQRVSFFPCKLRVLW